jgi:hypothetical protein
MRSLSRSLLFGLCLATTASARAQRADIDSRPPSSAARSSAPAAPAFTVHASGSSKAILVPFGPFITQTGVGAGGANVSELYTTFTLGAVGYNIYGYGMQASVNIRVADDFIVPAAQTWTVSTLKWLTYQTGAATTGTITGCNINLWNSNPNGQLPGGQSTTGPGNSFFSNSWTGVYRVLDSGLTAINRAIIQATCSGAWVPVLSSGTYWLDASFGGTLTSGPWSPPKTKAGQVPPTGDPWNGLQSVSSGAFAQVYDTGNPLGSINEPGDFLWQVEGSSSGGGPTFQAPGSFCTSKTSSLGCTPVLSSPSAFVEKSGAPATTAIATPVPGGAGLPGLLIYSKTQPSAPISTAFGFLCLSGFSRAGAFPATPGGTSGTCSGTYSWNLAAIAAGTATIAVGDVLRIQAWYRDPGFPPPGNANLTNGIDPLVIVAGSGPAANPSGISPNNGSEGTPVSVSGTGFGSNPADLRVLLSNGVGFADVTGVGVSVSGTVFKVGSLGAPGTPVTLIRGTGASLSNQTFSTGVTSNSSLVRALVNGLGNNFAGFTLNSSSTSTTSASSGTPIAGGLSVNLSGFSGNALVYRLTIKYFSGEYFCAQGRIDFTSPPSDMDRADHLAAHLNKSFGSLGVSASASGTSVRVSMAGAAYGGIVVAGI